MKRLFYKLLSILIFLCTMCFPNYGKAQTKAVAIIEQKEKKRVLFFAENTSGTVKEVFFKLDGKGFRKSLIIKKTVWNIWNRDDYIMLILV